MLQFVEGEEVCEREVEGRAVPLVPALRFVIQRALRICWPPTMLNSTMLSSLLSSLELSGTQVCEPEVRALLGTFTFRHGAGT